MFGLFKNPARDGRQLAKDARRIISEEREASHIKRLCDIAELLETELTKARERVAWRDSDRKVVLYELQRANSVARRSDQRMWTALTLTIIAIRAGALEEHGEEAIQLVDAFVKNPGVDSDQMQA